MKPPKLPTGRRPLGFGMAAGSERARLILLSLVMSVFLIAFFYVRYKFKEAEQVGLEDTVQINEEDMPAEIKRNPAAEIDHDLLREVRDGTRNERLIREPEPYSHLLAQARKLTPGDLEALGLRPIEPDRILADPALYRGEAVEVKGYLESVEVIQGQLWQEIRGTIRDPDDRLFAFSVLREPSVEVGQVVRLRGFFFKLFSLEIAPGEYADNVIYIVGRSLIRSFLEMQPVADLAQAPFNLVTDYDITDMVDLQEDLLYYVLRYVQSLPPEARAKLEGEYVEHSQLRLDPEAYRGKVVKLLARYVPSLEWPRKLGPGGENPLGVRFFWDGILALPKDRLVRWIGFERFPQEKLVDSKLVWVTGVFFKNFAWENTRGDTLNGPLLVPIRIDSFELPDYSAYHHLGYGIAGITLILVFLFFIAVFKDNRKAAEFRADFVRRKKRRLDRVMGAVEPHEEEPSRPPDVTADT